MRIAELMGEVPPAARPPALCYHRVGGQLELGVTRVAKSVFARQMTTLARAGWKTLTLDQFAERLRPGHSALRTPHSAFLLTFDDGYAALADPFGARDARIERMAIAAGYDLGFGGVHASGSRLALARLPVYLWDVGSLPMGLREDGLGWLGRAVAHTANRCAVGTSMMLSLLPAPRSLLPS